MRRLGVLAALFGTLLLSGCSGESILALVHPEFRGWQPLHFAAVKGDTGRVSALLEGGQAVDVRNSQGKTPLYEAAKRGQLDTARLLVEAGADVNSRNSSVEFTPLHVASEYKRPAVMRYLLAHGARVDARNDMSQTPLWQASWQPWHADATVAEILAEHGADLDAADRDGFTPLHQAAGREHLPLIRFLLGRGANPDVRLHQSGMTPLMWAVYNDKAASVRALLEGGVPVDARTLDGATALDLAVERGAGDIAALLVKAGADR